MRTPAKVMRDLPVLWKILVPFMALLLALGWVGTFLIVRHLSARAEVALEQELSARLLDVRASLQARELYLLESANLTANLQGMGPAVAQADRGAVAHLMRSVLALKGELSLLAVTDARGRTLVATTRDRDGSIHRIDRRAAVEGLRGQGTDASAAFSTIDGRAVLRIASPICTGDRGCRVVGYAVAAVDGDRLAEDVRRGSPRQAGRRSVGIYDAGGASIAVTGAHAPAEMDVPEDGASPRRIVLDGSALLVAPLEMQGARIGGLTVGTSEGAAFASVRGTGVRLALILLGAMIGVALLGWLLSRFILGQVRPLVETNRALEQGELSARAPVLGQDELGELARGINRMAQSLQSSHEQLEAKVDERTAEITRLLQERSDLFAALSHELRTPLAVVLAKADLMLDPVIGTPDLKARNSAGAIRRSAEQVLGVVNEILDLARAEAGTLQVSIEPVSLSAFVEEMEPTLEALVEPVGLTLTIDVDGQLPLVAADPMHLRKVIVNLVGNAVKYTPAGGEVIIRAAPKRDRVTLIVEDTGIGIPPSERDRVFEPFYRVDGTRPQHGQSSSGLGLALTRTIVEAFGGSIAASGRRGGGARITVALLEHARREVELGEKTAS